MNKTRRLTAFLLTSLLVVWPMLGSMAAAPAPWDDTERILWPEDDMIFEIIGQVKNSPPAGPGLPATSVQYGYLSSIKGLNTEDIFAPGVPQNEASALFTFYNDSVTLRVIPHGNFVIVNREGTSTIYFDDVPDGDLTTPNPDSFRDGVPILTSTWKHQVILTPSTGEFFVTWEHTITSAQSFDFHGERIRLGKVGKKYRVSLVGGPDPAGKVNGKFAGYATALGTRR